jgi:hypothetical protein
MKTLPFWYKTRRTDNLSVLLHGNQFCQRIVLRSLFPALNAPEICWVCGGDCACGATGGAKPLQTSPEGCTAVSLPALFLRISPDVVPLCAFRLCSSGSPPDVVPLCAFRLCSSGLPRCCTAVCFPDLFLRTPPQKLSPLLLFVRIL